MLYLVAILLPPLAVLMCGKPIQALINIVLTLALYFPGAIHAIFVVNNFYADQRTRRIEGAVREGAGLTAGAVAAAAASAVSAPIAPASVVVNSSAGPQLMTAAAVYPKPDLGAKPLATLPAGAPYRLIGTQGAFARIQVQGGPEGWIDRRLIGA